jgi:hypothetical protein
VLHVCRQALTEEKERLERLLQEKERLVSQWRQEANAAQEAADAASRAARDAEELSIQVTLCIASCSVSWSIRPQSVAHQTDTHALRL